jgi:hypothetical protein
MLDGLSRLVSGNLGTNGVIIGGLLIMLGILLVVSIHYITKKKD